MRRAWILAGAAALAAVSSRADLVNGIKAVVHDSVITYEQVEQLTGQTADVLIRKYRDNPAEFEKSMNLARGDNLEKLMQRELILHEFKTAGYSLPESVVDEMVKERIRSRYGDRRTLTRTLQAQGMTYEKFRQQVRDQFIVEALRQKNVASEILISPHKVERYYAQHTNSFKLEDQVRLRMIVLNKSKDDNGEQTRKLAEDIQAKIKDGASFAQMASIHSDGSEKKEGGLRPLQEVRELRKELADAILPLKAGEVSGIVETPESFWLLKVEEKVPAHIKALPEVREQIEKDLLLEEQNRLEKQWIERLRKKTFVRYF